MALHKNLQLWTVVLLGLFYISMQCDARAVNVSNTWTMPQEGLNVFYRFFRDRISWFEADAVCQFHHANLVTVDNSFQFDATRDLLRELDVNDIVWIGLMRPQSSERFMWSNSRPLVVDTGYWAESLPLMDAPLCAVIDPIRDYRWHALRCGGPETASFLCEMPVPSWADACILKDMPNLTMQYMADTASIELIRNCEEEGLLRQTCKGKQDREHAIRELICPRERLEAQRINDITNSHFKSLQIINSIRTDNNENNDIELLPMGGGGGGYSYAGNSNSDFIEEPQQSQTEKNTVQRLIEQFNVDELMQADEPPVSNSGYKIPGEIPKPVKKTVKKVIVAGGAYPKKEKTQKLEEKPRKQPQMIPLEDMMMGDQPHGEPEMAEHSQDDEVSNEIMEPLPHKKKILQQDLKTMATITEQPLNRQTEEKLKIVIDTTLPHTTATPTTTISTITTTTTTTTTAAPRTTITTTTIAPIPTSVVTSEEPTSFATATDDSSPTSGNVAAGQTSNAPPVATLPTATIGHPMHPQQQRSNVITEETQHPHIKESADNSHFIPPMLLVKSHYVPPAKHEHEHHNLHHGEQVEPRVPVARTAGSETSGAPAAPDAIRTDHHSATAIASDMTEAPMTAAKIALTGSEITTADTPKIVATAMPANAEISELPKQVAKSVENVAAQSSNRAGDLEGIKKTTVLKPISNIASNKTKAANLGGISTTTTTTIATTTAKVGVDIVTSSAKPTHISTSTESKEKEADAAVAMTEMPETAKPTIATASTTFGHVTTTTATTATAATKLPEYEAVESTVKPEVVATSSSSLSSTEKAEIQKIQTETSGAQDKQETIAAAATAAAVTTDAPATATTTTVTTTTSSASSPGAAITTTTAAAATPTTPTTTTTAAFTTEAPTATHNFLREDTEAPFKPNRRRSLTKPEAVSYFKKILG